MANASARRPTPPDVVTARFWAKVEVGGPDECWLWHGARNGGGYGIVRGFGGHLTTAHRFSLVIDGRDPGPLCTRHRCDTPPCVNPAHLIPGTHRQNMDDARERLRLAGERNSNAKLAAADVLHIRELAAAAEIPQREIAVMFGIHPSVVSDILRRRLWAHLLPA